MANSFHHTSYQAHIEKRQFTEFDNRLFNNSVDRWRHNRMLESLNPIIKHDPKSTWITIGDGRYGTDANFLETKGLDVLATDITDASLKAAKEVGFISKYKIENAEDMSATSSSFDYALCKEAYHHFPRPAIGLYEMLRISRKAVVLVEPNDSNIYTPRHFMLKFVQKWLIRALKNTLKSLLKKPLYYDYGRYEESGNYVYTISKREIEKVALGLNLPYVAFREMNDHYLSGVEDENFDENGPLKRKLISEIKKKDKLAKSGKINFGLLIAIIFKIEINHDLIDSLERSGFEVLQLPRNPFLTNPT